MPHCGECGAKAKDLTVKGERLTYFKGRHLCPVCLARLEHAKPPAATDIPLVLLQATRRNELK